jgi:hypothetical protein
MYATNFTCSIARPNTETVEEATSIWSYGTRYDCLVGIRFLDEEPHRHDARMRAADFAGGAGRALGRQAPSHRLSHSLK